MPINVLITDYSKISMASFVLLCDWICYIVRFTIIRSSVNLVELIDYNMKLSWEEHKRRTLRITGPSWGESTDYKWISLTNDQWNYTILILCTSGRHLLNENEWRPFLISLTALKRFRFKDYKYVETQIYFFANNFNMNPKGIQKQYEIS